MTTPNERFLEATKQGACNFFSAAGSSLTSFGVYSLVTGAGAAPLTAGLAAQMVTAYACEWDPDGPPPPDKPGSYSGCKKVEGGTLMAQYLDDDGDWTTTRRRISEIIDYYVEPLIEPGIGIIRYQGKLIAIDAETGEFDKTVTTPKETGGALRVIIDTDNSPPGATCIEPAPGGGPDIPTTTYTDPESGCVLNVDFQGLAAGQGGLASPVFKISPGAELRNDGGRIGGCNFEPTIYMLPPGGGGQPPVVGPWNPDWDGDPLTPWGDFLRDLAGGLIGNILYDQIEKLYATPMPGAFYELTAPCQVDEEGNPLKVQVEIPTLPTNDGLATRIEALIPILQGQKDFKQPLCPAERPVLQGDWRTISFRSEETSPFGKSRLRKRFRYRSLSGFGLEQLVDHWIGFSFNAGPVCVIHKGASWGTPQVWAATADEGKRVIRHAAGEAGLDPDQNGEWIISGSDNPRVGVSGTMNIDTTGGYYWITARDGSSERPIVAKN